MAYTAHEAHHRASHTLTVTDIQEIGRRGRTLIASESAAQQTAAAPHSARLVWPQLGPLRFALRRVALAK